MRYEIDFRKLFTYPQEYMLINVDKSKKWYPVKNLWIVVDKIIEIPTGYPQINNVMK